MKGRIRMELRDARGELCAVRTADNAVMQSGARLVALLFAGQAKAGITHLGVGTSGAAETDKYATVALSNDGDGKLVGLTEAAIPPEAITVDPPDEASRTVKVRIRATLPSGAAVGTVREAGLIARTSATEAILYNRVTFAPLQKGGDHELTMFWEVAFPYGDLQELL
jgi:hypothetical protein